MAISSGGFDGDLYGIGANGGVVYYGERELSLGGPSPDSDVMKYLWWANRMAIMNANMAKTDLSMLNRQPKLNEIMKNVTAENAVIPIVYGAAQVGGQIFAMGYNTSTKTWTVGYVAALGEIEAIDTVLINGAAPVAGVTVTKYTGTSGQTYNTTLGSAISGYTDPMVITHPAGNIGIAYIVVVYKDKHYTEWPQVRMNIRGKKVYNPTTGTTIYSTNPALHLADLITSAQYGHGYQRDNASLILAQNYCDDTTGISPTEARRTSYIVINSAMDTSAWIEILRAYAGCFLALRGDTVFFIPDKSAASVMAIDADDIVEGSMNLKKADSSDLPTVFRCSYTDTTGAEWVERLCTPAKASGVDAGTTPWRESRFSMVGINRHSQAYRECVERLNTALLTDLTASWVMFDEGYQLEMGDVVTVTHPYLAGSKTMRLTAQPEQVSPGRWRIQATEYNASMYSNDVLAASAYADAVVPTGTVPGVVTSLTAAEVLYQTENLLFASRLYITWVAPTDSIVTGYNIRVTETVGGVLVWSGTTIDLNASTGPLKEGVAYTVSVAAFNTLYTGTAVTYNASALVGKNAAPAAPTGLGGSNKNRTVHLYWTASADADVAFYQVKYYAAPGGFSGGTLLDETASLTFTAANVPDGTWYFGVKSIDSVNQTSAATAEVQITVAASPSGVTTFYQAAAPSALAAGDLWFETDASYKLYYSTGTGTGNWQVAQDAAAALAAANTKTTTWFQNGIPTSLAIGDIWIDGDSTPANQMYRAASIGATTIAAGQWVLVRDSGIATAQSTADGKNTVFYAASAPTANKVNDLWIDTTGSANTLKRAQSIGPTVWQSVQDAAIATAQATADLKNTIYRSASGSPPTGMDAGDIWIKSDDNNSTWRYESSVWVKVTDTSSMVLDTVVKSADFTAVAGKRYPIDTSGGVLFEMTLPNAPTLSDTVYFFDLKRTFDQYNLTILRAASAEKIMGAAEDMLCDVKNYSGGLMYVSATEGWVLI
jgi:Putative phage tail protein